MRDERAAQIGKYLAGNPSTAAVKCISYAIENLEKSGELELFISDEIDAIARCTQETHEEETTPEG